MQNIFPPPLKRLVSFEPLESRQFLSAVPAIIQTNLVTDGAVAAAVTDPNLINPWGLAINPANGALWVSDNGAGVSTLYNNAGTPLPAGAPLVVTIPPPLGSGVASSPTQTLFNASKGFTITNGVAKAPALFLFATEDGTISGWNPSVDIQNAILTVDNSAGAAVYKGIAIASHNDHRFLYAADFRNARIDVFNTKFQPVALKTNFADPSIPAGYAPFGIQQFGSKLIVTFALQNDARHDSVAGAGNGFVDIFTTGGKLVRRLASGGGLNAPWAAVTAPSSFGRYAGDILVGDFGDGHINVFSRTGKVIGQLEGPDGQPIVIDGLWALIVGNKKSGNPHGLYFAAGANHEADGLLGALTVSPGGPPAPNPNPFPY